MTDRTARDPQNDPTPGKASTSIDNHINELLDTYSRDELDQARDWLATNEWHDRVTFAGSDVTIDVRDVPAAAVTILRTVVERADEEVSR